MAPPLTPDRQSQSSWTSTEPTSPQTSWLLSASGRKSQADTPCTRFSLASTILSGAEALIRRPTAEVNDPTVRPPVNLKRKTSFSPWSLLQSAKGRNTSTPSRGPPVVLGEQPKSRTGLRWWSPNRSVLDNNKPRKRISPPVPPRPDALQTPMFLEPQPAAWRKTTGGGAKNEGAQVHQPVSSSRAGCPASVGKSFGELDPDKDRGDFSRAHQDGWDNVIPKQWVEDQFSVTLSETNEERSVYSQDNGEEEAKKSMTSRLTPVINDHGFLAGEMTLFEPVTEIVRDAHLDAQRRLDRRGRFPEAGQLQTKGTPRWPFDASIPPESATLTSTLTCSPVQHWLPSLRPPSNIHPSAPAVCDGEAIVEARNCSGSDLQQHGGNNNPGLHYASEQTSTSSSYATPQYPSTRSIQHMAIPTTMPSCKSGTTTLTPQPLNVHSLHLPRAPTTSTVTIPEEGTSLSHDTPAHASPGNQQPRTVPPIPVDSSSSWSTILCTDTDSSNDDDDPSKVSLSRKPISNTNPLPTNRPSDKNKPLPLLPDEPTTTPDGPEAEEPPAQEPEPEPKHKLIQIQRTWDSLNDTIDQILDLYHSPGHGHSHSHHITNDESHEHHQSTTTMPPSSSFSSCSSSTTTTSWTSTPTLTSTATLHPGPLEPSSRALHTPDTDVTFMIASARSAATRTLHSYSESAAYITLFHTYHLH
ncbi:hypothetical protein A1O7_00334 [Cladophialophora yegresii CBS 114405]|uniref:Uncharacterized protein n=1 Tax=Cladophialophora yegresii CBS 114405 TaxID=1182544 RepID=W9X0I1_9EURO|nr:uncharacterized protein A1O7_00334 [Cladophialophora yegresii CBS 114405]EXJ63999.1 hypothetical protein A1O7_00334 [Cladophialophora yegresii CBS 114405]